MRTPPKDVVALAIGALAAAVAIACAVRDTRAEFEHAKAIDRSPVSIADESYERH